MMMKKENGEREEVDKKEAEIHRDEINGIRE